MTKRRKVARLDRAHLLNLVRRFRADTLRHGTEERAANAAGNRIAEMWHAGAGYVIRHAALAIAKELRRQQQDDERANAHRSLRRRRRQFGARV